MKKLMFLFMTMFLVFFTTGISSAQSNKTRDCYTYDGDFGFPCVDEVLLGSIEICFTSWEGKTQIKFKGTYIGLDSRSTYTFSLVENTMYKDWIPGQAYTSSNVGTATIDRDGVTIAITKLRSHFTVNANGEVVVDKFEILDWECY